MRREELVNVLMDRGYKAEITETVKNGVVFEGIVIYGGGDVSPIIYTEELIKNAEKKMQSAKEVVDEIIKIYDREKNNLDFDVQNLFDKDWMIKHLSIGLQKESNQEMVKKQVKEFSGIEAYLYVKEDRIDYGCYRVKLNSEHLKYLNLSEEKAWRIAYKHICEETEIISIEEMMSNMMGISVDSIEESGMYVVSNRDKTNGASCILNREALKEFANKKMASRIYVLPSSLHEMIIVPDKGEFSIDDLSKMVEEVNCTQVDPEEQLPSRAYILEF